MQAKPIPKWLLKYYSMLWITFNDNEFYFEDAKEKIFRKKYLTSQVLNELRKAGWVEVIGFDNKDFRKRIYRMKKPEQCIAEIGRKVMT